VSARRWEIWVLPGILAVAAVNFFWQLGTSSFYVDEALSIEHALPPIGELTDVVRATETTPYTYFVGLNQWLYHGGSQQEFDARLPQVIAGIALVAATYWMARCFVDRRPALVAAGLCALSPFVLEYAQQVRVYVWAMLAVVVAVGATVRGVRGDRRWLWLGGGAAVCALLLHYTATFVIAPLCVWLVVQGAVNWRARGAFVAACVVAEAALVPLFLDQYRAAPNGGELADADLGATSVARLLATPFDGRWIAGVDWLRLVGLAAMIGALAGLLIFRKRAQEPRLLLALALIAPLALILAGIVGKDVLVTRYAAVAAPFLLTALAAALFLLPRPAAAALATLAAVASIGGLVRSHGAEGRYPPAREAIDFVAADSRAGDWMFIPGETPADIALGFYAERRLSPLPVFVEATDRPHVEEAFASGSRIWIVRQTDGEPPSDNELLDLSRAGLEPFGYEPVRARAISTSVTYLVILAQPQQG
jgi:4-amino-4-deoxy-L-arabinose transferase-like glycosyltransferase